jgi:hypothetical protein
MLILGLAGACAYSLVSLILGMRLLLLARRTRRLPELLIGLMLVSGGLGFTLYWVPVPHGASPLVHTIWGIASGFFVAGGCVAMLFAVWRIFRPGEPWAGVVVGALIVMVAPGIAPRLFLGSTAQSAQEFVRHPLVWAYWISTIGSYAWMALESLRTQARLRRQHRFGLGGDLAVAGRLLLWGLGTGFKALLFASTAVSAILRAVVGGSGGPTILFISGFGLLCSLCLWLAFFPPRGYLDTRQRSASSAS